MLIAPFREARSVSKATAVRFRAPRRVRPSEAAASVLRTEKGPWRPELTPYLLEPLDQLGSREYRSVIFVGPARTGKTMTVILGGGGDGGAGGPGGLLGGRGAAVVEDVAIRVSDRLRPAGERAERRRRGTAVRPRVEAD